MKATPTIRRTIRRLLDLTAALEYEALAVEIQELEDTVGRLWVILHRAAAQMEEAA